MGLVTDYLRDVIARQVDDHGLVVWYDPERHYEEVAAGLSLPRATVARYDGSFFELRAQVDGLLESTQPPRLVIYVPLKQDDCHSALVELEVAGVVLRPGQQPPARNTRLAVLARNALKTVLNEELIAGIQKQIDAGKLTLADLDRLASTGAEVGNGVLALVFGTGNPPDVALAFLTSDKRDAEITQKDAGAELASVLATACGITLPTGESLAEWRARLARYILATDLAVHLGGQLPAQLASVKVASEADMRVRCRGLAATWRLRRDLRDNYVAQANQIEQQLGLSQVQLGLDVLLDVETFAGTEGALQRAVEESLLKKAREEMIAGAQARQSSFWSEAIPGVQARWALIAAAGHVLSEADRIEAQLKKSGQAAEALFAGYVDGDAPWCLLDTHHRHMERRSHQFDFDLAGQHASLEQLIAKARERYMSVGAALAEGFVKAYRTAGFKLQGRLRQAEIFEKRIRPRLTTGKTAYFWVDALRFEMARELAETLHEEFDVLAEPSLGTAPTITEIGMAALLPGAEGEVELVPASESKLALKIAGAAIKDRKDRLAYLKAQPGISLCDVRLDELLPSPKKKVREGIQAAGLVVVTSQEIDALAENDNIPLARRTMDEILHELHRAFRVLAELGVKTIVVAADHGYLFGDELGLEMKIDPPGGDTADLHRRVWVGHGGAASEAYLRAKCSDFGLAGDLEIAVPYGFGCFKVKGGASAYFHGGLSPQELIVPVLTLTSKKTADMAAGGDITWTLTPGSKKISSAFCSIQVEGTAAVLLALRPPKVRLEVRVKERVISVPVAASYGFEEATGNVQLKLSEDDPQKLAPISVTLQIPTETGQKPVAVHLVSAASGVELARLDIELAINM